MKMLFFSSDTEEVQEVGRAFADAGIACEVRRTATSFEDIPSQSELWVHNDRDCHRALMLCVQQNIGFARRPEPVEEADHYYELESAPF